MISLDPIPMPPTHNPELEVVVVVLHDAGGGQEPMSRSRHHRPPKEAKLTCARAAKANNVAIAKETPTGTARAVPTVGILAGNGRAAPRK